MYAFLDTSGVVLGTSYVQRDLAEAKIKLPDVVEIIVGAPEDLIRKDLSASHLYHQKTTGDGTLISDYVLLEDVSYLKAEKYKEIDQRTGELISAGFEFPAGSGQIFSLSQAGQMRIAGSDQLRDDPNFTYPVLWNYIDDSGVFSIPDSPTLHAFCLTAVGTYRAHVDSGTTLKEQVRLAQTKSELDAIIDTR